MSKKLNLLKKTTLAARRNLIVIADTHIGCRLALCSPDGIVLDDGGLYKPSAIQLKVWDMWDEFWNEWVPRVTHKEPFTVIHNGDAIDGVHHNSTTQISHNIEDQVKLAEKILSPVVTRCEGRYYHIRGTEAHVGPSATHEENLAHRLGAIPNETGQYARWELWIRCGNALVHCTHHIPASSSSAYESTAVYKEMVEAFVESGRFGEEPPQVIVRSHRHRQFETKIPTNKGYGICFVTAGFQLKTPFVYRINMKQAQPQIGGSLIRAGDEEVHTRHKVWNLERPRVEE